MMVAKEEGVTLIELLIAVALLGIVIGSIAAALIVGISTSAEAEARVSDAAAARIAAAYFGPDVAGSTSLGPGTADADTPLCEKAAPGSHVLTMSVTTTGENTDVVLWLSRTLPRGKFQLLRQVCGQPEHVVFHGLSSPPTVACEGSDGGAVDCAATDDDTSTVRRAVLLLTGSDGNAYPISGTRRLS